MSVIITCDICGQELRIGDFPFCPHGRGGAAVERDEIPGGVTVENYGPNPITFFSHSERRAYMKAHGLQEREKYSPLPGTDRDPAGIPNPIGYMDPQTLENARVLLSRNGQRAVHEAPDHFEDYGIIRNRTVEAVENGDIRLRLYGKDDSHD